MLSSIGRCLLIAMRPDAAAAPFGAITAAAQGKPSGFDVSYSPRSTRLASRSPPSVTVARTALVFRARSLTRGWIASLLEAGSLDGFHDLLLEEEENEQCRQRRDGGGR